MKNDRSPSRVARRARHGAPIVALLCAALALPLATAAAAAPTAKYAVELPPGAGKPTPGSGIYTQAALDNPRCTVNKDRYPYGRFSGSTVGGGAICTRPFKTGDDNGGATSTGVEKDSIKVVVTVSNPPETRSNPAMNLATGATGTDQDAEHDLMLATRPLYETWGRELDITFYTVNGTDEASQRAAAVAIKAMKPFAVVNSYNAGYGIMAAELAKAKILVYDAETGKADFEAFAPFLWGSTEPQVAAINVAEVVGKQLVGGKAEYAGDDLSGAVRKFGLVSRDADIDVAGFKKALGEYKGTVTSEATYPPTGGTYGDATLAGQFAPTIVAKMKADGVTTMVLFTDAAMNKALMEQATAQNWFPEWFHSGNSFADYSSFASTMPVDQREHFFGISGLSPYVTPPTDPLSATMGPAGNNLDWYWGLNKYTSTARIGNGVGWLFQGIHSAGPKLTPETFKQGQFSLPAVGGSASGLPLGGMIGYGRTTGLPYDQFNRVASDFLLMWMRNVEAPDATGALKTPSAWYVKDPKTGELQRYRAGTFPTKKIAWFDPSKSIVTFETIPPEWGLGTAVRTVCEGCPSTGATSPTPGTPSPDGFVVPVPTTTPSAS